MNILYSYICFKFKFLMVILYNILEQADITDKAFNHHNKMNRNNRLWNPDENIKIYAIKISQKSITVW